VFYGKIENAVETELCFFEVRDYSEGVFVICKSAQLCLHERGFDFPMALGTASRGAHIVFGGTPL
jgi:hypothetical protein